MSTQHLPHPAAVLGSSMVAGFERHRDRSRPGSLPADPRRQAWYIVYGWVAAHLHLPHPA
ncbi:MAG TPA: hypothetical protein VK894_05195 [Jiangellales bacterium]|nr:hypothetical protein [Jiangellales bacterium]